MQSSMTIFVFVFNDREAKIIKAAKKVYTLRDIKKLLHHSMKIRQNDKFRYYFLIWCRELHQEVKDETVSNEATVPTYGKDNIILHIEK